jgi:hypothetical protein
MKKISVVLVFIVWISSCSLEQKKEEKTFNSIYSSKAFVPGSRIFPNLIIEQDTLENGETLKAKIWLSDAMFKELSEQEKLRYSKTFYLDSLGSFNSDRVIKIDSSSRDTLELQFIVKLNNPLSDLESREWSFGIYSHFTNDNGFQYDTGFIRTEEYVIKRKN